MLQRVAELENVVVGLKKDLEAATAAQGQVLIELKATQKLATKASLVSEKAVAQLEILLPAFQQRVVAASSPQQMQFPTPMQHQHGAYGVQAAQSSMDSGALIQMIKTAMREMGTFGQHGQMSHAGFTPPQGGFAPRQMRLAGQMQTPVSGGWYSPFEGDQEGMESPQIRDQQAAGPGDAHSLERQYPPTGPRRVFAGQGSAQSTPRQMQQTQTRSRSSYSQQSLPADANQQQGVF